MGDVVMFNLMTIDGFFEGTNHDISWHNVGAEYGLCDSSLLGWSACFLQRFLQGFRLRCAKTFDQFCYLAIHLLFR